MYSKLLINIILYYISYILGFNYIFNSGKLGNNFLIDLLFVFGIPFIMGRIYLFSILKLGYRNGIVFSDP